MVERKQILEEEEYEHIDKNEIQSEQTYEAKFLVTNIKVFEEYQNQLSYGDWKNLLDNKKFNYKQDHELNGKVRMSVYLGIHEEPKNIAR